MIGDCGVSYLKIINFSGDADFLWRCVAQWTDSDSVDRKGVLNLQFSTVFLMISCFGPMPDCKFGTPLVAFYETFRSTEIQIILIWISEETSVWAESLSP
jgi:hypothetical protein